LEFWNFGIDDFALYDIPDTIDYILRLVEQPNLVYIGFSQGSAQAFAALSINPQLNNKIKLFIALAPAMSPQGLTNRIVDTLTKANPSLIYLFFGKRAILKSTTFWQSIMYPPLYVKVIDWSLDFLFKWKSKNISFAQKMASYAHLYSYTSVKSVVHWFQIMRSGRFHMYDDDVQNPLMNDRKFYKVAPFPTQNIITPILLLYGKSDTLVDIRLMLSELPASTAHVGFNTFEHLDLLCGDQVDKLIFPYILSALQQVSKNTQPQSEDSSGDEEKIFEITPL
jgi:lysosomal acid lipase/cholesteryl ester hydrolase